MACGGLADCVHVSPVLCCLAAEDAGPVLLSSSLLLQMFRLSTSCLADWASCCADDADACFATSPGEAQRHKEGGGVSRYRKKKKKEMIRF